MLTPALDPLFIAYNTGAGGPLARANALVHALSGRLVVELAQTRQIRWRGALTAM
jgi:hypothetical protein